MCFYYRRIKDLSIKISLWADLEFGYRCKVFLWEDSDERDQLDTCKDDCVWLALFDFLRTCYLLIDDFICFFMYTQLFIIFYV